jgi:hypothetical protein
MKLIQFVFVLVSGATLLFSCSNGTQRNLSTQKTEEIEMSELADYDLRGKVKLIRQEEFLSSIDGQIVGIRTGMNSFTYEFDNRGVKINEQTYDSIGMIKTKSEYFLDHNGVKKKKKIKTLDGQLLHTYEYWINNEYETIKVKATDYVDNDVFTYFIYYSYDSEGNQIGMKTKMLDGTVFNSSDAEFKNGLKIKSTVNDNLGSPVAICEYEYNTKGDVAKEYYYLGNGQLFSIFSCKYTYDDHGNWIKKVYSLDEKTIDTNENRSDRLGVQTITFRTITYFN